MLRKCHNPRLDLNACRTREQLIESSRVGPSKSQKPSLHAPIPCPREKNLITFIRCQLTLQHEIVGSRRETSMRLDASFPWPTAKPGFQDNLGQGPVRIRFANTETLEHRVANLQVDGIDADGLRIVRIDIAGDRVH